MQKKQTKKFVWKDAVHATCEENEKKVVSFAQNTV